MGLQITGEQRDQIQKIADKGTPVYVFSATSPENNICNLDSIDQTKVQEYLDNGNKKNYQNLARYIRQNIDKKKFFVQTSDTAVKSASDVLYHLDETVAFERVSDYEDYLKKMRFYTENAPKVAIVGGLNDPFSGNKENVDSLIAALQNLKLNVYPVSSFMKRLEFLQEIQPDAVIYFAHGRMAMGQADAAVDWLKERNIPIFAPLSLLQTKEEWLADPMGMFGGFLSQSIVTPELDGAIYPYVLNAQEVDAHGLYVFKAIPERLQTFTQIVHNFISLQKKSNAEKKVAIYYFQGGGKSLAAQGLETVPSLYNFLKRLKTEGYKVDNLPANVKEFEKRLFSQENSAVIEQPTYETWVNRALPKALYADALALYGESGTLSVNRLSFGNIVLLPQPLAGRGDDTFAIVHGTKAAPPHEYIAAYLWSQFDFQADAMLHFGTHGSLEFTPQKQVALSHNDWPDRLVGAVPHFYYYTIGNIGESMMAKRRSYATTVSYLTPAFMESEMRSQFKNLQDKMQKYYKSENAEQLKSALEVKKIAVAMGLHRDLRLDSTLTIPYSTEEIERIENFAEEIANEKMSGSLYTSGIPYPDEKIRSTVLAMSADPIAYSLANLDKLNGKTTEKQLKSKTFFTQKYLEPARLLVNRILNGAPVSEELICATAHIQASDLAEAKTILAPKQRMMPGMSSTSSSGNNKPSGGGHPAWIPKFGKRPDAVKEPEKNAAKQPSKPEVVKAEYTAEQKAKARAIVDIERTIQNIIFYKNGLEQSPEKEFQSLLNALSGGYIAPSSGGDAVANPQAVPTGRNLYAINAEATPSESAWEKGVSLVDATLEQYKKQHGDYPRKVSYTFWSSEFIESEGTTIAQVLYMLGVEPVRDSYGRVSDLQLISSEKLGRPRIDVVVQTSGQFRDLAASRLELISRAVEMSASANEDRFENRVANSAVETERLLVEQGISPKEARELSMQRVFGGINGMYGTNIQGMVTGKNRQDSEKAIAGTYIHNMGAVYGNSKNWGQFQEGLLRAALHNTDVVIQPRQSNTWGALSLDHVYEFMGGLNLAVREVTGKDPEAYFADYRNRHNMKIQELKEAIGVEARSTVFNPAYIREVMKGNASSAAQITEVVTNTYAWNVLKPNVIDNEMWDKLYEVYVKDEYQLGTEAFFKRENPYALQEITGIMLESAKKGMWKANAQQLSDISQLNTALVKEFGSTKSGFSSENSPESPNEKGNSRILKKEELGTSATGEKNSLNGVFIVSVVLIAFVVLLVVLRRKRKKS
jgi:cobaltochelatase CobN